MPVSKRHNFTKQSKAPDKPLKTYDSNISKRPPERSSSPNNVQKVVTHSQIPAVCRIRPLNTINDQSKTNVYLTQTDIRLCLSKQLKHIGFWWYFWTTKNHMMQTSWIKFLFSHNEKRFFHLRPGRPKVGA